MFLWGVVVFELDSHPIDHIYYPYYIADNQPFRLHGLEVLTVYGNELPLFGAYVFPLLVLLVSHI